MLSNTDGRIYVIEVPTVTVTAEGLLENEGVQEESGTQQSFGAHNPLHEQQLPPKDWQLLQLIKPVQPRFLWLDLKFEFVINNS